MNEEDNIQENEQPFDYDHVKSVARIAAYDDLSSAPRMTIIEPAPTDEFITNLATTVYEQAKMMGGDIPFTIIREVSENFIHAKFEEMTVSILDRGNTIRFADQGPGISNKDKAKLPGFSSAIEPMKHYIRGVGSGLPIVQDYFNEKHGTITIDDNVLRGAVVTISLKNVEEDEDEIFDEEYSEAFSAHQAARTQVNAAMPNYAEPNQAFLQQQTIYQQEYAPQYPVQTTAAPYYQSQPYQQQPVPVQQSPYQQSQFPGNFQQMPAAQANVTMVGNNHRVPMYIPQAAAISDRGKQCLKVLQSEGMLGVTEVSALTGIPQSSVFNELEKLEESGFIEKTAGKKRVLTNIGLAAVNNF